MTVFLDLSYTDCSSVIISLAFLRPILCKSHKHIFHSIFSKAFFVIDVRFDFCKYLTMQVTNLHKQDMRLKPTNTSVGCMCFQPLKRPIIFWSFHLKRWKKPHSHCEGSHILQSAEPRVYDHDSFLTFSPNDRCGGSGFERMKSRSQFLGLWHQFDDHHVFCYQNNMTWYSWSSCREISCSIKK